MSKVEIGPVTTVGDLREKIRTLKDDEVVHFQVAAEDGSAWNMRATAGTALQGTIFGIVLRHPNLKTLPKIEEPA